MRRVKPVKQPSGLTASFSIISPDQQKCQRSRKLPQAARGSHDALPFPIVPQQVQNSDKQHAERCALIDALMQQSRHFQNLSETLIAPLDADRMARIAARQAEVNASRVDFFTMVRGDNA